MKQTTETNGLKLSASFARYDRDTCSWKTSQLSLLTNTLEPYLETWLKAGMIVSGIAYELVTRVRRISVTDSGLWPSPAAQEPGWKHIEVVDKDGKSPQHPNQRFYDKNTGRLVQKGLTQVARMSRMWGTPRNCSSMSATINPERAAHQFPNLETQVARTMWRTPDAGTHNNVASPSRKLLEGETHSSKGHPIQIRLVDQVEKLELWPTPRANKVDGYPSEGYSPTLRKAVDSWGTPISRDHKDTGDSIAKGNVPVKGLLSRQVQPSKAKGALNPTWVEWLMGIPLHWTSMEPLPETHVTDWMNKDWWQIDPADNSAGWEYAGDVPRISVDIPNRVNRLKGLGNAQVPLCVYLAWILLTVES